MSKEIDITKITDSLIGVEDIDDITYILSVEKLSLVIEFSWKADYGCFNLTKKSTLTVNIPNDMITLSLSNLYKKQGEIWEYIKKHKDYVGELITIRKTDGSLKKDKIERGDNEVWI